MKISILGSTGSIGTQTLACVREHPERFEVAALAGRKNIGLLEEQAREFRPRLVSAVDEDAAAELRIRLADTDIRVSGGEESLIEAAELAETEAVVIAVVGMAGIEPTIAAIRSKKRVALANKETLVAAGNIIKKYEREYDNRVIPVDSEHSAIFQSLSGAGDRADIKRILLTASGGAFFGRTPEELKNITPEQALHNPNWDMGAKVTIDSSTLVNKGLEVIEAKWLFEVPVDSVRVVIHRESVLHSAVEFADNAVIAQLGAPDMRLPIQFALTCPERLTIPGNELDLVSLGKMTFYEPDTKTFPALELAREAGRAGGMSGSTLAAVFNGADEEAVKLFMSGRLKYTEITEAISGAMARHGTVIDPTLEEIYAADREARVLVLKNYAR